MSSIVWPRRSIALLACAATWFGVAGSMPAEAAEPPTPGIEMPHDASEHGHRIDSLIHTTNYFIIALFLAMVIWMLWACLRHNHSNHEAVHDRGDGARAPLLALGIAAFVFFIVDGNLFVNSTLDIGNLFWNYEAVEARPDVLRIEINAHQWVWDARYAGPDGEFGTPDDIVTLNDIRVPVATPILFQMGSTDVIHSLYLPNFRIKADVIPGNITRAWLQAKETGRFEIACAQHCGIGHYKMRGVLTVLPKSAYLEWEAAAVANALRAYDATDTRSHWGWKWRKF